MTTRALFSGTTNPTPADINARFSGLVAKGIYTGGLASATGSNNNVSVSPYIAVTSFGMLVSDDAISTVGVSPAPVGTAQYVCIHAVYSPSGPATVELVKVTTIPADTLTESYICVCTVKPYASGFVSNDLLSYDPVSGAGRDQVTPVRDTKYLGYFTSQAARNAAYPNHVAGTVSIPRIGDTTSYGTTETNYVVGFWDGLVWRDLENTGALKAAYDLHIVDYTLHTTSDQHAALAGTAGTPSSANRYVTQQDTGILSNDHYLSIQNALGGPADGGNPLIAKGLVIAVPRVFQVAVATTTSKVFIDAAALGRTDFVAYLGKQGNNGQSSAVQYFAIEDDYGNGYISTVSGLPVYVTDVLDETGTNQINPGADSQVDSQGFYDAEANGGLTLQLSSEVAVGTRLYVRMNLKGDISALTPNWPGSGGSSFLPAITAFRNGKESYVSALLGDFNTLVVGTSTAGTIPNTQISTVLAGAGIAPKVIYAFREGQTVRASISTQTSTTTGTGAAVAGTMTINTPRLNVFYDTNNHGVVVDSNGLQSYLGIFVTTESLTPIGGIDLDGRIMAAQGSAAAPGIYFAGELDASSAASTATGIYYKPTYTTPGSNAYGFDTYNGIGLSVLGKTALFVARTNDSTPLTDMDCPLMVLQNYESAANTVNYYIGMNNEVGTTANPDPGIITFGAWSNLAAFNTALELNIKNLTVTTPYTFQSTLRQILGKNGTVAFDETFPAYSFVNATSTGMFYVDSWSNNDTLSSFANGVGFSVNGHAALIITQDVASESQPITGTASNPLIINQRNDGIRVTYDFAVADAELGDLLPGAIRFGSINYTGVYRPLLSVNTANSTIEALVKATFADRITVNTNNVITSTGMNFSDAGQGVLSTGSSVLLGNQGGAYVEVLNSAVAMNLVGDVTVHGSSTVGVLKVVGSSANDSVTGAMLASPSGLVIGYGTTPATNQKIFWGAINQNTNPAVGYLTTNGRVFAAPSTGNISYGFAGMAGLGMGVDANQLRLYGNGLPILMDGDVQFDTAYVGGNFGVGGTLTANQVAVTTSVTAATVSATGNITGGNLITAGDATVGGVLSGPTITSMTDSISANVSKINVMYTYAQVKNPSGLAGLAGGASFIFGTINLTPGRWWVEASVYAQTASGSAVIPANTICELNTWMDTDAGLGPAVDLVNYPNPGRDMFLLGSPAAGTHLSVNNGRLILEVASSMDIRLSGTISISSSGTLWDVFGVFNATQLLATP